MEQDNILILSEKLLALLKKRRTIKKSKSDFVKKQNYEKAAAARDSEKENGRKIYDMLQQEFKYDFSKSKQVETDIMTLLDLVEDGDTDFTNAIAKLNVLDLERLKLMKNIELYNYKEITLDELHDIIKDSFQAVREDVVSVLKNALNTVNANTKIKKKLLK